MLDRMRGAFDVWAASDTKPLVVALPGPDYGIAFLAGA